MQRGGEILKFSRGNNVDQTKHLRKELDDALEDIEEEKQKHAEGIALFEACLPDCRLGGNYASDYQPIVDTVPHDILFSSRFWMDVFKKFGHKNIAPHGIFSALPPDVQNDVEIQTIFFGHPNFSVTLVPRTVLERVEPSLFVTDYLSIQLTSLDERMIERAPWNAFSPFEKKRFIKNALNAGLFRALEQHKAEFSEIFSEDEWNEIVRTEFRKNPEKLVDALKEDAERPMALFSKEELRTLLRNPRNIYRFGADPSPYFFLHLPLSIMRTLEFDETEISQWKARHEGRVLLGEGFEGYQNMAFNDRTWILSQLSTRATHYEEGHRTFISETLPKLMQKMPPAAVLQTLKSVEPFLFDHHTGTLSANDFCDGVLRTVIESQGASAFRTLEVLRKSVDNPIEDSEHRLTDLYKLILPDKESIKVFRNIMSKTGTRFQDFFSFYLDARFASDELQNLISTNTAPFRHENNLAIFIDAKLPWTTEILWRYEQEIASGRPASIVAKELYTEVQKDIDAIVQGDAPEKSVLSAYQLGLLSHVFPPALGVSREAYARLVQRRDDRSQDIPYEWETLQGQEAVFPLGTWELTSGEQFETAPWTRLSEVITGVNTKTIVTEEKDQAAADEIIVSPSAVIEIGRSMLRILRESHAIATKAALRDGYALFLARGGAKLPDYISGREEGARMFEWSKDSLRDVVDVALRTYREADPAAFDHAVREVTKKDLPPNAKKIITKSIAGIIKNTRLHDHEKSERIHTILKGAGVESAWDVYQHILSEQETVGEGPEALEQTVTRVIEEILAQAGGATFEAGKISSIIVQKILGADAVGMEKEMAKWTFIEGAEGGEERKLRFHITKQKLHAVAGLNMGVCVAVDDRLWNKPEFSNVVLFGDDGVARGGMHIELVRDQGKTYLSLPGINPNLTVLREVDGKRLLQTMLDYAKACAQAIGADAVFIPTNPTIFSNREELHGAVRDMKLPTRSLSKLHQFSYSPFAYSWQDAYEIAVK